MGLIGVSLIVASLLCFCIYPRVWLDLAAPLRQWCQRPPISAEKEDHHEPSEPVSEPVSGPVSESASESASASVSPAAASRPGPAPSTPARRAMPPPPLPLSRSPTPQIEDEEDEPTTPKATLSALSATQTSTPLLSLSLPDDADPLPDDRPPMFPAPFSAQRAAGPPLQGLMAPPPPRIATRTSTSPSSSLAAQRRPPGLSADRGLAPARTPSLGRSLASPSLASPSLASPSARNKVHLTPGHSPLDWARLTADPHANLRNMPPEAPQLLRVTPSLLKTMNGRRGRDAWTALGGMVYNLSPYLPFHPGGEPELLRCAGRDGNRLFHDVHSWVNYDNMLSACRIGILVEEHESVANPMEEMD